MSDKKDSKQTNRREFIQKGMRLTLGASLAGVAGFAALKVSADDYVWQLDPFKCVYCGRCADYCVVTPSAVPGAGKKSAAPPGVRVFGRRRVAPPIRPPRKPKQHETKAN